MAVSHYKSRQLAVCFMPRHVSEVWKYIVPCGTGLFLNILYMPLHVKEVKQTNCSAGQTIRNLVFIRLHSGENSSSLLIQAGCMEPMAKLLFCLNCVENTTYWEECDTLDRFLTLYTLFSSPFLLQNISLHGQAGQGQHQQSHSRMGNHDTSIVIQQALPSPQSSSVITQAPSTNRQIGWVGHTAGEFRRALAQDLVK